MAGRKEARKEWVDDRQSRQTTGARRRARVEKRKEKKVKKNEVL